MCLWLSPFSFWRQFSLLHSFEASVFLCFIRIPFPYHFLCLFPPTWLSFSFFVYDPLQSRHYSSSVESLLCQFPLFVYHAILFPKSKVVNEWSQDICLVWSTCCYFCYNFLSFYNVLVHILLISLRQGLSLSFYNPLLGRCLGIRVY